ncbi:MAG: hypothetical protein RR766_01135 [Longicatena sp.]
MNDKIIKSKIMEYAEKLLSPMLVENATLYSEIEDTNIWLIETDTQEEYWVLSGIYPSNIYKKSGIYNDDKIVYASYIEMLEEANNIEEERDRYQYPH